MWMKYNHIIIWLGSGITRKFIGIHSKKSMINHESIMSRMLEWFQQLIVRTMYSCVLRPRRLAFLHRNRVRLTGSEFICTENEPKSCMPNSIPVETNSNPVRWTQFLRKKVSLRGFRSCVDASTFLPECSKKVVHGISHEILIPSWHYSF